jgi:hypothetical protein
MRGAGSLLREGRVDILAFEYGDKWTSETMKAMYEGHKYDVLTLVPEEPALNTAIQFLDSHGMDVFFLGQNTLVPASGDHWTPLLQICLTPDLYGLANGGGQKNNCWYDLVAIRRKWPGGKNLVDKWVNYAKK